MPISDLKQFHPGQPITEYLSQAHLNAVLEAMRIIDSRSSSAGGGMRHAVGHLRSRVPDILNRDIIVAKNITHVDYLNETGQWYADRFYGIRKFQPAVIYPPEEIRSDKDANDRFSEGYAVFTAMQYGTVGHGVTAGVGYPDLDSDQNLHPTIAIALHDIPECSEGLFLLSGTLPRFSGKSYESRQAIDGVSSDEYLYDSPYQVDGSFRTAFPVADVGDTLPGGGGVCSYSCVADQIKSITGYFWEPSFGACGPNTECPNLGNCSTPGQTTTAPCDQHGNWLGESDYSSRTGSQSIAVTRADSLPGRMTYDGLAVCTDMTGDWSWFHVGNTCSDGTQYMISEWNLPPCTEDLCGKLRPSLCEELPTTTYPPTTTTTTQTTACPVPSTDGYCYAECGYDPVHNVWRWLVNGDPNLTVGTACAGEPNGCTGFCCLAGGHQNGCGIAPENGWCHAGFQGIRIPGACRKP